MLYQILVFYPQIASPILQEFVGSMTESALFDREDPDPAPIALPSWDLDPSIFPGWIRIQTFSQVGSGPLLKI